MFNLAILVSVLAVFIVIYAIYTRIQLNKIEVIQTKVAEAGAGAGAELKVKPIEAPLAETNGVEVDYISVSGPIAKDTVLQTKADCDGVVIGAPISLFTGSFEMEKMKAPKDFPHMASFTM